MVALVIRKMLRCVKCSFIITVTVIFTIIIPLSVATRINRKDEEESDDDDNDVVQYSGDWFFSLTEHLVHARLCDHALEIINEQNMTSDVGGRWSNLPHTSDPTTPNVLCFYHFFIFTVLLFRPWFTLFGKVTHRRQWVYSHPSR